MCLLDSLLGGRRRAPEDDEPRPWISRRHLLGFYPIFRIEGAADHLDPEDGFRLPVEAECRGSADTHNPDFTISSTHVHDRETPIPIGLEEVFTTTSESLFTVVWNDCSRSMELLFTLHPPSSGGFRSTVSLSDRVGSAGNPSSQA